jgi:cytoskeletal protein CcmA (bactofilin family)
MFFKKKSSSLVTAAPTVVKKSSSALSIIASDIIIYGNIHSDGVIDINGRVEGNVRCHTVTIRKNGHIKGDLIADNISIYGRVQGLVKGRSVSFFKGCQVEGVIQHETVAIEDGAFVDGRFKRCDQVLLDEPSGFTAGPANSATAPNFYPVIENVEEQMISLMKDESDAAADVLKKENKSSGKASLRMLDNLKLISDTET